GAAWAGRRGRMVYAAGGAGLSPPQPSGATAAPVRARRGGPRPRRRARVAELLELVGLEPGRYAKRYPHELSGGQRQRVGVARALAADPIVLLMDEPFSAVDPIVRGRLQEEFIRLRSTVRKPTILVTHDLQEAIRLGARIAVLSDHGHLEQFATPAALPAAPANAFVEQFIGEDRGIMRLSVTPVPRDGLRPPSGGSDANGGPTVAADAT